MKFKEYIDDFRKLNVGLTKSRTDNEQLVRKIQEEFDIKTNIMDEVNSLNKVLGRHYSGKMKFDFILEDQEKELKLKKKAHERIKLKQLELNDELSKLKTLIEAQLREKYK